MLFEKPIHRHKEEEMDQSEDNDEVDIRLEEFTDRSKKLSLINHY